MGLIAVALPRIRRPLSTWGPSSSSWNPCPSLGSSLSPRLLFVLRLAGGLGGMGRQKAGPHCRRLLLLLPRHPVASGHGIGHGSLVPVNHLGDVAGSLLESYSAVKHASVLWLGKGQREHRCAPSRDWTSALTPLLTPNSLWSRESRWASGVPAQTSQRS